MVFEHDASAFTYPLWSLLGRVPNGLLVHPDGEHIIYPLGSTVIIQDLASNKQQFLAGHSNYISCLTCSLSGKYLASGQVSIIIFIIILLANI